ncbi:MAG: Rv3235 family protein [Micrococcaceae bacterium]
MTASTVENIRPRPYDAATMRVVRATTFLNSATPVSPEFFAPHPSQCVGERQISRDPAIAASLTPEQIRHRLKRVQSSEVEREIHRVVRIVGLACIEAELGLRSVHQLSRWMNLPTYEKMNRRSQLARRTRSAHQAPRAATRTLSSRLNRVDDAVYEANTSVKVGDRVRAAAMRIERHRTGWKVTAIELG